MITRQQKETIVAGLIESLRETAGLYLIDFTGLKVSETIALRRAFKSKGVKFKVAKNTLIKRAADEVGGFDIPDTYLKGQSGLAFGFDDPSIPAKVLKEYLEKNKAEKPTLKVAIIDKQVFDGKRLKELASLPSREDMIAAIIGSIHAPVSGIVGSINAVLRDVAYLVEEVAKKKAA